MGASKLLHRILNCDLWPWPLTICYKMLQNATPSPFLTWFWFRLLYVVALGEGFKNSTQNFDFWLLWPLTLIFHFATKCYSFAIFNPISIPFVLCDSTRWGLQNFYTEFWPLTPLTFDVDFWPILFIGYKMLLLRHFYPNFDSVCFMW